MTRWEIVLTEVGTLLLGVRLDLPIVDFAIEFR